MNEQRLTNIWNTLSNDPDAEVSANDFETWKANFLENDSIQTKVYNYLKDKELTKSDPTTWKENVIGETTDVSVDPQVDVTEPQVDVTEHQVLPTVVEDDEVTPVDISHPTLEQWQEGEKSYWNKEEDLTKMLNKFYSLNNPGKKISFVETVGGRDAIEVLTGDQMPGEGTEFKLGGGATSPHVDFKEAYFGKKHGGLDITVDNDAVFSSIQTHINMSFNPDFEADVNEELSKRLTESTLSLDASPENKIKFLSDLTGKSEYELNYERIELMKPGPRGETDLVGVEPLDYVNKALNVMTFGQWEGTAIDMDGGITMDIDGKEVFLSNKYLWDNREKFAKYQKDKKFIEELENKTLDYGKGGAEIDPDNPLTGLKYLGVDAWADEAGTYQSVTSSDDEIVKLAKMISTLKKDPTKTHTVIKPGEWISQPGKEKTWQDYEVIQLTGDEGIKYLEEEFAKKIKEFGIKPIWEADDPKSGNIDIKRTIEEGVGEPTEEETKINNNAEILARDNEVSVLIRRRREAAIRYLNAIKLANENVEEIYGRANWFHKKFDELDNILSTGQDDREVLKHLAETNDLFGMRGSALPGNSKVATDHNEAREEFLTLNTAISLNHDHSQDKEEIFVGEVMEDLSEAFTGRRFGGVSGGEVSRDKEAIVWSHVLTESGFTIPDANKFGSRTTSNARRRTEGAAQVITDLGPLLAELWMFKRVVGPKNWAKAVDKLAITLGGASKRAGALPAFYKFLVNNVVAPGVATTFEWATAETAGEAVFGWKGQTIDWETGETRFMFPFAMGAAGKLWQAGSKAIYNNLVEKSAYGGIIARANSMNPQSSTFRKVFEPYARLGIGAVGKGATATGLLTVAELVQEHANALMKDGRLATAAELKHLTDKDHLVNTFIAMTVLSGRSVIPEFRESVRRSVAALNKNTIASQSSAKTFGLGKSNRHKDGKYKKEDVDRAAMDKINEINNETREKEKKAEEDISLTDKQVKKKKARIREEAKKKKKKVKKDKQILENHNRDIDAIKAAKTQGNYNKWLWENYERPFSLIQNSGNLDEYDREKLAKLDIGDIEKVLTMKGFKPGDRFWDYTTGYHELLSHYTRVADGGWVEGPTGELIYMPSFAKGTKQRKRFIENGIAQYVNESNIKHLQKEIKDDPDNAATKVKNKAEIKRLEEANKELQEQTEKAFKTHEIDLKILIKAELEVAKKLAETWGVKEGDFHVLDDAAYRKIAPEGSESEGFYNKGTGEIFINFDKAMEMRSMGAGIHEVIHHVLKSSLKESWTDSAGVERSKTSEGGMDIIDAFRKSLPDSDRKFIDKRVNDDYKFEEFTKEGYERLKEISDNAKARVKKRKKEGRKARLSQEEKNAIFEMDTHKEANQLGDGSYKVEIKPEHYYEEYITVYGQGLRERDTRYQEDVMRRIGRFFYPLIKRRGFGKLYADETNGTNSKKAAKDLYNMIGDMYVTSERMVIKEKARIEREMADKDFQAEEKVKKEVTERIDKGGAAFSKKKVNAELDKLLKDPAKTKKTIEKNESLQQEVIKSAKKAGLKTVKTEYGETIADASRAKEFVTQPIKDALVMNNLAAVNALAKLKYSLSEGVEDRQPLEDLRGDIQVELVEFSRTWNPATGNNFMAYVFGNIAKRYPGILDRFIGKSVKAKSIEGEATSKKVAKIAGGVKATKEKIIKQKSKFKKFFVEGKGGWDPAVPSRTLVNKFRHAVQSAFRTAGDIYATAKNKPRLFLEKMEKSFENDMFKTVKNAFGTREVYKDFIDNSFEMVREVGKTPRGLGQLIKSKIDIFYEPVIDLKTGKQAKMTVEEAFEAGYPLGKHGPRYEKLTKEIRDIEAKKLEIERNEELKPEERSKLIAKNNKLLETTKKELKKLDKTRTGLDKWKFVDPGVKAYKSWAKAKDMSGSTYGTRKDGLARILSIETAKDAVPTALRKPIQQAYEVDGTPKMIRDKNGDLKPVMVDILKELTLQQKTDIAAKALTAKVLDVIDRGPDIMFSKKKIKDYVDSQEMMSYSDRIMDLKKPENFEIKKVLDESSMEIFGVNYEAILRQTSRDMFLAHELKDLTWSEYVKLTENAMEKLEMLEEISVSAKNSKEVFDNFPVKIEYTGLDFLLDTKKNKVIEIDGKKVKVTNEEWLNNHDSIVLGEYLPEHFFRSNSINPKDNSLTNTTFKTSGMGKINNHYRFDEKGNPVLNDKGKQKTGVRQKVGGNEGFTKVAFGKELKDMGKKGVEIPTMKDVNGFERPITDAFKATNSGEFKAGRKYTGKDPKKKGTIVKDGVKQFWEKNHKNPNYKDLLIEWGRDEIKHPDFTYEQTYEAARWIKNRYIRDHVEYVYDAKTPAEFADRAEFVHKKLQIQTVINDGLIKGLNIIRFLTTEAPTPLEQITYRSSKASGFHAEHAFYNLAHTATVSKSMGKHRRSKAVDAFMKEYELVEGQLDQYIIAEAARQLNEGMQKDGTILSNTENVEMGNLFSMLNVLAGNPRAAFTTVDLLNKEYVGDHISKNLKIGGDAALMINRILGETAKQIENRKAFEETDAHNGELLTNALPRSGVAFSKNSKKNVDKMTFQQKIDAIKKVDKAFEKGRKVEKERRGISVWDFDDTLARTKSGVIAKIPNVDGQPKPGRKVIFMAGGPGSGKSSVIKQLSLEKQGFKVVNQDISLQWLAKNHGLPTDMRDFTPEQLSKWSSLGWDARMITKRKQAKFQGKGDGIIIDGTGNSLKVMKDHVREFENKGYDVKMVFVETSLETALQRNRARKERSLRDFIVTKTHESVMANKLPFKLMFGKNFIEVKTDNLKIGESLPSDIVSKMDAFTKSYENRRLDAEEFAREGKEILDRGGEFDFKEFDYVKGGEKGPLFKKAMDRAKKYGVKDQFILTARPHAAKNPIAWFLMMEGLKIPTKNIITLENSTPEAKAMWMLEKASEGYNDFYFADDAIKNVEAVKNVLDQLDVKSDVQQAMYSKKKKMGSDFRNIIEDVTGFKAEYTIKGAKARELGKVKRSQSAIVPQAQDFMGLMQNFFGRGAKGEGHQKFFEDNLQKPFATGYNDLLNHRQTIMDDMKRLKDSTPEINKVDVRGNKYRSGTQKFRKWKNAPGSKYSYEQAIRVYLWNKAGFKIPEISSKDNKLLVETVNADPILKNYADRLGKLSKHPDGYIKPKEFWTEDTIMSDMFEISTKTGQPKFLAEFIENKNIIFSKENMKVIEATQGPIFRNALEDILYRMEKGTNRPDGTSAEINRYMNYINGAVGATMFLNMRSAIMQQLSTFNFTNWHDNNPLRIAKTFANPKQFWNDYSTLWNSNMLRQRRGGMRINVQEAEIAQAAAGAGGSRAVLNYLFKLGYKPTTISDSHAISFGGASFYRNRINTYLKKGVSLKEAEKKAFIDFQEKSEPVQQSSRPDLISEWQASKWLGRLMLAWGNTQMQNSRVAEKSTRNLINKRGNPKENLSKMGWYGFMQPAMYGALSAGLFALFLDEDDSFTEKDEKDKIWRAANTMLDSQIRGLGVPGSFLTATKNTILEAHKQEKKGYRADHTYTLIQATSFSPTVSSKLRKMYGGAQTFKFNRKIIPEMSPWDLDNPAWGATAQIIEGVTNLPTGRLMQKRMNMKEAIDSNNQWWQRASHVGGWAPWDLGTSLEEIEAFKESVKKKKKKEEFKIYHQ